MAAVKKVCFFVTPIGHANSSDRKRADNIKKYILNEVLSRKYKVIRADEMPQPGSITHQVIKMLYQADLVVADLTTINPNVVYELAIRHSFNKVSVHLIDKSEQIPFDLKDERTIAFDLTDPDSVDDCKQQLMKVINEIDRKQFEYNSPIFRVLGVAAATVEERENFLERVVDQLDSIASDVSSVEIELFDLDEMKKALRELKKDIYDMKLDIREILNRLK